MSTTMTNATNVQNYAGQMGQYGIDVTNNAYSGPINETAPGSSITFTTTGYVTTDNIYTGTTTTPNYGGWVNSIPYVYPQNPFVAAPAPIDMEQLKEGVYLVKGGKLIIKKVMVDDDAVKAEELKQLPVDSDKVKERIDLHEAIEAEEREI